MKTEIISLEDLDNPSKEQIDSAANVIKNGGLVVFPTETVYGLGADATNPDAISKIFLAKGRPSDNPLIIHIAKPEDAELYAYSSEIYYKLAKRFMPGPLTVVLKSKETVPYVTRGGLETVALRCPASKIARLLISSSETAIAAPSANISGSPSPTDAKHVIDDMNGKVDVIIDGGICDFGLESTIVKIEDDDTLTLLRPGKITIEELESVASVKVSQAVTNQLKKGETAISPGMKYRHYAPKSPVILLDGSVDNAIKYIKENGSENIAIISYEEYLNIYAKEIPEAEVYNFGSESDPMVQAHRLFKLLREIDKRDYTVVYAPLPDKQGVSLALYNRMIRAAAHKIIRL